VKRALAPLEHALALALLLAASPAFAASEEGHGGSLFWQTLNVLLLLGVLIYFARKPVLNYLAERRDGIAKNLESSAALLADAERRLAEWTQKAANLDREAAEIRAATLRAAEAERDRILADARVMADRIRRSASAVVERELQQAREALRREAADLAVEMAAKTLREQVNDADRTRLLDEFIGHVEREAR
jgi:F-type H+-transporting ATPase subunit b